MKHKIFDDNNAAAEKLYNDVGVNNVKFYDVQDYERISRIPVHPSSLTSKWSKVIVAVSGDLTSSRDWMVVAPYRVDESKKTHEKCLDIDPVLFVIDRNSGSTHPSGAVAYHQDFSGRTTEVPGYKTVDLSFTVSDLRAKVITGLNPLPNGPPEVLSSLQHMVKKFRADFLS
jgi:hypothetical protein